MSSNDPPSGSPLGQRPADVLERIKRVVASYADAPPDIEDYAWFAAPRYCASLGIPLGARRRVRITPPHEDRHAGVAFRVGWDESKRVAAVWILRRPRPVRPHCTETA